MQGKKLAARLMQQKIFNRKKGELNKVYFPRQKWAGSGRKEGNKTVRGTVSRDFLPHYFHDSNLSGPLIYLVSISWINLHVQTILQCNRKGIREISALA